jgi:hypothetical protein
VVKLPFRGPLPKPPKGLKKPGRTLWGAIQAEYGIDDPGGLAHLVTACRSEDDIQRMRDAVATEGDTITDRFNQRREHPLLAAIRGPRSSEKAVIKGIKPRY